MLGRLTLVLALLPAIALAAARAGVSDGGRPVIPARPKPAAVAPAPTPKPTPVLISQPAAALPVDPAECRATCAQTNYFCRAGDHPEDCGANWGQCVVRCNTAELDSSLSAAP